VNIVSVNMGVQYLYCMLTSDYFIMVQQNHKIVLFVGFLRNLHIDFHSGCTNGHSLPLSIRVPFYLNLCWHLLFVVLMIAILTGVKLNLRVVLICIPFMAKLVEQFFRYIFVICILLWGIEFICTCSIWLLFWCLIFLGLYIFWILILHMMTR
jgi:hypothetical protein